MCYIFACDITVHAIDYGGIASQNVHANGKNVPNLAVINLVHLITFQCLIIIYECTIIFSEMTGFMHSNDHDYEYVSRHDHCSLLFIVTYSAGEGDI